MEFVYIVNKNDKIIGEFLIRSNYKGNTIQIFKPPEANSNNKYKIEFYTFEIEYFLLPNGQNHKCIRTDFKTAREIVNILN